MLRSAKGKQASTEIFCGDFAKTFATFSLTLDKQLDDDVSKALEHMSAQMPGVIDGDDADKMQAKMSECLLIQGRGSRLSPGHPILTNMETKIRDIRNGLVTKRAEKHDETVDGAITKVKTILEQLPYPLLLSVGYLLYSISWNPGLAIAIAKASWDHLAYPWTSIDIHGYPWISMDIHGCPWISMDIHGCPWIAMDMH